MSVAIASTLDVTESVGWADLPAATWLARLSALAALGISAAPARIESFELVTKALEPINRGFRSLLLSPAAQCLLGLAHLFAQALEAVSNVGFGRIGVRIDATTEPVRGFLQARLEVILL